MMESPEVQRLQELMVQRKKLEDDIISFQSVLKTNGVGMDDPLVDSEGYPRSDIDVYSVRKARHQIICLKNDIRSVMTEIENGLHQVHGIARERQKSGGELKIQGSQLGEDRKPFLIVKSVAYGSPAHQAGLFEGDLVLRFGTIVAQNFIKLQSIGELVQNSKGRETPVIVQREGKELHLSLVPNAWQGRGLLGCLIDVWNG